AYEHQEVPFEKVVEEVVRERDLSRSPLFQVMLVLRNTPEVPRLQLGEVELTGEVIEHSTAKFELTFFLTETPQGLQGAVSYRTDLFSAATIERMIAHFKELLHSITENAAQPITRLPLLTASEEDQLLYGFNQTEAAYPNDKSIVALFEQQVEKTPHHVAVVFEEEQLTYQELNERSNQLAHYLRGKGVKEETLVPICLERSLEMLIGILGILKAGAAYVPIDPEYPLDRIAYMLQDTAAAIVINSEKSKEKLPASSIGIISLEEQWTEICKQPSHNPQTNLQASHLAYVIYTSGSTGTPKGVMVEHKALVNRLNWAQDYYSLSIHDAVLQKTTFCFDVSVWELLWPLLVGSRLVFAKPEGHRDNHYLKFIIDSQKITMVHFVPSMLSTFLSDLQPGDCKELKKVLCSGEALKRSQVELFKEKLPEVELHNLYGPTEAAIDVTYWSLSGKKSQLQVIPIGKPIHNTQIHILDEKQQLLPIGIAGEIYIAGAGLARGYLNREELTKDKFILNPFVPGARMYRTGDVGRWMPDGNIEYMGRRDEQVKIRGYRIELGEIESVIQQSGLVSQGVVLAKADKDSNRLVGYVVPAQQGNFDLEILKTYLRGLLPEYMVPTLWMELDNVPLTSNGKVNKKLLPDPEVSSSAQYVAPRNDAEELLVNIWQQLLGLENVGIHDNFFELGGHSLLAIRMIAALRKQMQVELLVKDIFLYPTIAQLAEHLQSENREVLLPSIEAVVQRPERLPLSFAQERLWFIDQLEGSVQYHVPAVLRLKGTLNKEALSSAFQTIIDRHEVLRTIFLEEEGLSYQYIQAADGWKLSYKEDQPLNDQELLDAYVQEQINAPFDLSRDYMLRAELINLQAEEYILIVVLHHIASDGWSTSILVRELVALYSAYSQGHAPQLNPLPLQYADYALWQRNYLQGEVLAHKLTYW
ncbi:amino acid adenylation domain-containing protein, partial [Chitinophagaceae bacterium LB-8]